MWLRNIKDSFLTASFSKSREMVQAVNIQSSVPCNQTRLNVFMSVLH